VIGSAASVLERPPLDETRLREALLVPDGFWTELRVLPSTGSTNQDVRKAARAGTPEGLAVTADQQTAGRGRLDRVWQSPPRAGLAVSVLLRPGNQLGDLPAVAAEHFGWLPLLAGVALVDAVRRATGISARLKWPNDLLVTEHKCAGILAENDSGAVVIGIGLNTTLTIEELPHPGVTSLALSGAGQVDRTLVLRLLLEELADWYRTWRAAAGDPVASGLAKAYRERCGTLGRGLRVTLPAIGQSRGTTLVGTAVDVDQHGRLMVCTADGQLTPVSVGDVVHVRPW
jgi:BirA family transcriptional regulator, biotin operon repressor / biotin---[acetyl-CoA-carboxylase] ligase